VADQPAADPSPPSRRQEHKLRTQRALQQAALDMFAEQGYDTTTTDEIAERAGVSPRTFFRYFPTKESVLFLGEYGWFQSFTKEFLAQDEDLSDLEALQATLVTLIPAITKIRRALLLYHRAVASSPALRGGVHDHLQEDITTMAEAIATRRGMKKPDEACIILATVVLMIYRRSVIQWMSMPASTDPREVLEAAFDHLLAALSIAPRSGNRRKPLRTAAAGDR
jgi:AcrR family transcriptional regulator